MIPCRNNKTFHPTELQLEEWKAAFPEVDIELQMRRCAGYLKTHPQKQTLLRNAAAYFYDWLLREVGRYVPKNKRKPKLTKAPKDSPPSRREQIIQNRVRELRENRFQNPAPLRRQAVAQLRAEGKIDKR